MNDKVFVTGACGFIGSHLVEELVKRGKKVKAFTYYNSFNSWGWLDTIPKNILSQVEVICGDIRDPFGVKKAMEGCDTVYHLAALIAIPYSYHSPATYIETNIQGTLNIVQAAKELDVKKIVHTSTSEVYGTARFVPITEEHPLIGQSPYSASKIGADQIAYSFYSSFQLPVAIIRPFNTFGPRQSARAIIPTIISQIASGKQKIQIGSLTPTRDFNYVADTVNGFISVAESKASIGEVINVGSGFEISIGELIKTISALMKKDISVEQDSDRMRPQKSEVERLLACNKKADQLIGWKPQVTGLEGLKNGLSKTIEWFSDSENLKKYKTEIYNI